MCVRKREKGQFVGPAGRHQKFIKSRTGESPRKRFKISHFSSNAAIISEVFPQRSVILISSFSSEESVEEDEKAEKWGEVEERVQDSTRLKS